jgi:PIN domain nuclease of toxin-antitoxin system
MLNLDTHVLLHALGGGSTPQERELLQSSRWSISAIVLWEIAQLDQLGRINLGVDSPLLIRTISRLKVWALSREVARATHDLDFRSDPADELIAATSLVYGVPLLTRDGKILASDVVPLAH